MSFSTSQRSLSNRSIDSGTSNADGNTSAAYVLGKDIRTAAINNDEETLLILLEGQSKLVNEAINEGNSFGRTALWFACSKNYDKILSILIKFGADVNKADNAKETPAYIASRYNNAACLSILLKNGANMHLVEKRGEVRPLFSPLLLLNVPILPNDTVKFIILPYFYTRNYSYAIFYT